MDYKLKLNIKSIVLYERLTGESFSQFSPTTEKVIPLLYCILVANNDFTSTFEDAIEYLFADQEFVKGLTKKLEDLLKFNKQFSYRPEDQEEQIEKKDEVSEESKKSIFISQLVPILVSDCGLDINYILNDMYYTEIDSYINYRDQKYRSDMEEKRLFTYLGMSPHVDTRKCKIESILPFPWEKEKKKKEALENMRKHRSKLDEFMKSGSLNKK